MVRKLKLVVICALGMSSSLVVKSLTDAARKRGIETDVSCTPSMTFRDVDYSDVDAVLVAPQVRGQIPDIQQHLSQYRIPVVPISMSDYGLVKGEAILTQTLTALESHR